MSIEVLGYMTAPATQQKNSITARKNYKVKSQTIKQKVLGAILIALGVVIIPMENDVTIFIVCLFLGIAAMIGDRKNRRNTTDRSKNA